MACIILASCYIKGNQLGVETAIRTSCVGSLHAQNHDKSGIVRPCQIVADQSASLTFRGKESKAKRSRDVGEEEYDDKSTTSVEKAVVEEYANENGDSDDKSVGYLNVDQDVSTII